MSAIVVDQHHILTTIAIREDNCIRAQFNLWQRWVIAAGKTIKIYCGISTGLLFLAACLIITGRKVDLNTEPVNVVSGHFSVPLESDAHLHSDQFYIIILIFLSSMRGGIFYLACSIIRSSKEKNSEALGLWLVIATSFLVAEALLGVALFQCVPGLLSIILLFLSLDMIIQGSMIWIVWNFKLVLLTYDSDRRFLNNAISNVLSASS